MSGQLLTGVGLKSDKRTSIQKNAGHTTPTSLRTGKCPALGFFTGAVVQPIADISCWFLRTTADLTQVTLEMMLARVREIVGSQAKLSN
jgi:hypothetical protein